MPRLFVAAWPPDDVLDRLSALPRPDVDGLRWTGRAQWHVTLRFLGAVNDLEPVRVALAEAAATSGSVLAFLGPAVGRFGPRILHVPVTGLDHLAATVVDATAHLGQAPDDRPFTGHVTLARVARTARPDLGALAGAPIEARWALDSVCLVESHLSPEGPRYEVRDVFPLSSGDRLR